MIEYASESFILANYKSGLIMKIVTNPIFNIAFETIILIIVAILGLAFLARSAEFFGNQSQGLLLMLKGIGKAVKKVSPTHVYKNKLNLLDFVTQMEHSLACEVGSNLSKTFQLSKFRYWYPVSYYFITAFFQIYPLKAKKYCLCRRFFWFLKGFINPAFQRYFRIGVQP